MSKILDADFRKELYKNLIDGGYTKAEAEKMVGGRYMTELKDEVIASLDGTKKEIEQGNFNVDANIFNGFTEKLQTLAKLKETLEK